MPAHPLLGVCIAFASHFLLDALPHWDYPIRSVSLNPKIAGPMKYDRALFADMVTIGADVILGIVLALILFTTKGCVLLVFLGACAAILPDAFQFAYMRLPREPLASLQRFHQWVHTSHRVRKPHLGIISQFAFVAAVVIVQRTLLP
jgi:hypothetical protein